MTWILVVLVFILLFIAAVWLFMKLPQFGRKPMGARMEKIKASPHFQGSAFQNLSPTPALTEGSGFIKVLKEFFFGKSKRVAPASKLPSGMTDLKQLDPDEAVLVWFGHSSYFLQLDGKRILVDPVFSGHASPVRFSTRSFKGADIYTAEDMPEIDFLFITHDHYDHLDYPTVKALQPKVGKVITGLGVGAHLERWGYHAEQIIEKDWNEQVMLGDGFTVYATPGRHFSGRGFKRNGTLWLSFVLVTPSMKIFLGGDSGYDTHFAAIGAQYGPFDLAILENGQYNPNWKYIHMMPEETVKAASDLRAQKLFPVHWAKFALSTHAWDDSIIRVTNAAAQQQIPLLHPMIGEKVSLDLPYTSAPWWNRVPDTKL